MYYSDDIIEEIREGNDIVDLIASYINLKQKGGSYFGLCPFHNESTPSFSVSTDKQLFHCFGCGASGNVYSFVMQMENYDFMEAIKFLADRIHYSLPESDDYSKSKQITNTKNVVYNINKLTARFFYDNLLSEEGNEARKYLDLRLIDKKMRVKYGLGYSSKKWDKLYKYLLEMGHSSDDIVKSGLVVRNKTGGFFDRFRNRLMFPIFDVSGKVIGFGGRSLSNEEPKYLNSPETIVFDKSRNLYSLNYARQSKQKEIILVEGYIDVITLYQAGFSNVVAVLGTALNVEHAKLLYKYADSVILLFDGDSAGITATLKAIPILLNNGLKVKVLTLSNAKDPDEFIKNFGSSLLKSEILNAKNHIDFQIENISKKFDFQKAEEKISFAMEVSKILSSIQSEIELDVYISHVSKLTGISQIAIKSELNKHNGKVVKTSNAKNLKLKKKDIKDKGLYEAKKNILYVVATNFIMYKKIKNYLQPYEMGEEIYIKVLDVLYNLQEKEANIYPADIVNYFKTVEEQKIVSDIFSTHLDIDNGEYIEQIVSDQVKKIKKSYIDFKISKIEDVKEVQPLIEARRNIENLNISILDG